MGQDKIKVIKELIRKPFTQSPDSGIQLFDGILLNVSPAVAKKPDDSDNRIFHITSTEYVRSSRGNSHWVANMVSVGKAGTFTHSMRTDNIYEMFLAGHFLLIMTGEQFRWLRGVFGSGNTDVVKALSAEEYNAVCSVFDDQKHYADAEHPNGKITNHPYLFRLTYREVLNKVRNIYNSLKTTAVCKNTN